MVLKTPSPHRFLHARLAAAATACLALPAMVHAVEIDLGDPDYSLRLDTTLRYNLGVRTQAQDPALLANPNYDDGDRNFNKKSLIANRIDLLSELDFVVQKKYGFRLSAAGWGDAAYRSLDNTNDASANTLVNGVPTAGALSSRSSRFNKGVSGELLDAFVFFNDMVGEVPVGVRLGRHTTFWGEGLFGGATIHGISYGQNSLDLAKGLATPGVEAKELFRPRNALSLQVQPAADLTLLGQVFLDWERVRYPESGAYLTVQDGLLQGGDTLVVGPGQRLYQASGSTPKKTGDWGLAAKWNPTWLNGTAGLYLRRTADIQPQVAVVPAAAALPAATCSALGLTPLGANTCYLNPAAASLPQLGSGLVGQYRTYYGRNIDILGLSYGTAVAGVSLGTELSYRRNMPLNSIAPVALPAPLANPAVGQLTTAQLDGLDIPGARGNTLHAVITALGLTGASPLVDASSWAAELAFNRWLSVGGNVPTFKGNAAYANGMNGTLDPMAAGGAPNVDAVTKNYVGLSLSFTPTWYRVLPSLDLSMPLSWSGGLSGVSAVSGGGAKGAGTFGVGLMADYLGQYNFALRYIGFYGPYSEAGGAMVVPANTNSVLSDRGHVMFTFKTTF